MIMAAKFEKLLISPGGMRFAAVRLDRQTSRHCACVAGKLDKEIPNCPSQVPPPS